MTVFFPLRVSKALHRPPATLQIGTNPRIEAPVLNARIRAGACMPPPGSLVL